MGPLNYDILTEGSVERLTINDERLTINDERLTINDERLTMSVSLVSPRIVNKIRENPRDTQESFPVYPSLPPPFSHPSSQFPSFGGVRGGHSLW